MKTDKETTKNKPMSLVSKSYAIKVTFQGMMQLCTAAYQVAIHYESSEAKMDAVSLNLLNDLKGSIQVIREGCDHIEKLISEEKRRMLYPQA